MSDTITLTRPDDWHVHFRDGTALSTTVPCHAKRFGRVVAMPNLTPPLTTVQEALAYRQRLLALAPEHQYPHFNPLMTLYLTDNTPLEELERAAAAKSILGVKLYPAGATTNSDAGVTQIGNIMPQLRAMAELQLPLLVHAEVTDPHIDIFDREAVFLESIIKPLLHELPDLKLTIEHITTAEMADFVAEAGANVAATLTPQHLLYSRNALFQGGVRPHLYCLPVLKRERHRRRLIELVMTGCPRLFLGSDSAPHAQQRKESSCGCAGIFSGAAAIEIYAQIFANLGILSQLEGFASRYGADFYQLPPNTDTLTLCRDPWSMPPHLPYEAGQIVPLLAGERIEWRLSSTPH
ncbi:dihydroorotase [Ectothiorhodospiraceae bacterium BW-2]|nr:dihydroorotase [Ectothiorhodospiraceae bacterium BW-2]